MDRERLNYLLTQYKQENCSEEEYAELDQWFHALNYKDVSFNTWVNSEGGSDKIISRLYEDFKTKIEVPEKKTRSKIVWFKPFYKTTAAAAILLIIGAGFYLCTIRNNRFVIPDSAQDLNAKNDIAPGRNTAILTLPDGKKITLSSAKSGIIVSQSSLTYSDGSAIRSQPTTIGYALAKGARQPHNDVELSTPRGGQYQIILEDGTRIYLNAASSLKYPSTFTGLKERKVILEGEAYFIVKHNNRQPFKVETKGQIVEDIGTAFNINAYPDEISINTTLIEGSAKVSQARNDVVLKPGQQAIFFNNTIKVAAASIRNAMAWKQGKFVFDDESLASIMRKIARWYDVDVIYGDIDPQKKFGGSVSRFENVSKVLEKLELTESVHFRIEGKKIYVKN